MLCFRPDHHPKPLSPEFVSLNASGLSSVTATAGTAYMPPTIYAKRGEISALVVPFKVSSGRHQAYLRILMNLN
jgi:hypothetical protein